MKKYLSFLLVVLCFTVITAGVASAASATKVYLKDGAVIECQKVWRSGGKIMVLVNRDVLLDFSTAEVDLKKTFTKKGVGAKGKKKHLKKPLMQGSTSKKAAMPVQKPVSSVKKVAAPAKPVPAKPAPPTPPVKPATVPPTTPAVAQKTILPVPGASRPATTPISGTQAALSSAKIAVAVPQPPKPAPRPAIKFVPPPPPPPEPFYKDPLVLQLGGGLLIVLLLVLLVMRKKKA